MPILDDVARQLSNSSSIKAISSRSEGVMPSVSVLSNIMERLKASIFPGYFGDILVDSNSLRYHQIVGLDNINRLLTNQIVKGLCFSCEKDNEICKNCEEIGANASLMFMQKLPEIQATLIRDAQAAYEGDPAAKSPGEAIFCYPSLKTMFYYRVAHELYKLKIPLIPRIISEMAHSETGIDIHPGAQIGNEFFIDHGTGVVIGETAIIGNNCRLYQGVTLGALSFPKNEDGSLTKGNARHPILEDNVIVYAGATILGRIIVGHDSVIGGNVWLTSDVPPYSKITQDHYEK